MVHEHLKGLRLDRRALRRRGWISDEELRKELEALPDVSSKIEAEAPETPAGAENPVEGSKG